MTLSHPTSGAFVNSTLISVEKSLKVIQGLKTIVDRQWMVAISTISWEREAAHTQGRCDFGTSIAGDRSLYMIITVHQYSQNTLDLRVIQGSLVNGRRYNTLKSQDRWSIKRTR